MTSGLVPIIVITFSKRSDLSLAGGKLLIICLTKRSCLEYTRELIKSLESLDPIVICSKYQDIIKNPTYTIPTFHSFKDLPLSTIKFIKDHINVLNDLHDSYPKLKILITAFHPWNAPIIKWAKKRGVPVTTVIHDSIAHIGEKQVLMTNFLTKYQIKNSDKLVFLTESELSKAEKFYDKTRSKSLVSPHPVMDIGARNVIQYSQPFKCLFIGHIKKYKGIDFIIDAAKHLPNVYFTIAGKGDINEPISSNVKVISKFLEESEIKILLEEHHCLLMPYMDASQSGVLSIGVASGIPMIISDLPGLKEQCEESAALWIDPSTKGLISGIEKITISENYVRYKKGITDYQTKVFKVDELAANALVNFLNS